MHGNTVCAHIDAQENCSVDFLKKLIAFDTSFSNQGVRGKEGEAQRWLERQLADWGFETRLFEPDNDKIVSWPDFNPGHDYAGRPNLVGLLRGTGGGKSIILNGHIDTVPLDDVAKWAHHPLSGEVAGGCLYGRGACDMKAGLAAMILAVKYLRDCGVAIKGDIVVESVVDEEGGGNGTLACVAEGYKADAAIVTEPTGLEVYCASRGVFLLEIEVPGRSSHACFKWRGVNAIEKGMKIVRELAELERCWLATRRNPLLPPPTITLGQIEGGISAATVPGSCILRFDVKYLPTETDARGAQQPVDAGEVRREVEECVHFACRGDSWLREHPAKLRWFLSVMPHTIDMNDPFVSVVAGACDTILGGHVLSGMPSGADARHIQNSGGVPTVLFGPGRLEQAHSIDEYVELAQYLDAIKALAVVIADWTNREQTG